MSPRDGLSLIFAASMLVGVVGALAHFIVLLVLYRLRIPMNPWMTGMWSYLLRRARELPPSPTRSRLILLEKLSLIAFLICVAGASISGSMLGSLHESERNRLTEIAH